MPQRQRAGFFHLLLSGSLLLPVLLTAQPSLAELQSQTWPHTDRQCGEPSPRLLELGDAYHDLNHLSPSSTRADDTLDHATDDEAEQVHRLLQNSQWRSGQGYHSVCRGSADALRLERSIGQLDQIRIRPVAMIMDPVSGADQDWQEARRLQSTLIKLHEYQAEQRLSHTVQITIPADSTVQTSSSGSLISHQSRRRQKTATGSRLRESTLVALYSSGSLVLEQSLYVNGTLAEWHAWHLQR